MTSKLLRDNIKKCKKTLIKRFIICVSQPLWYSSTLSHILLDTTLLHCPSTSLVVNFLDHMDLLTVFLILAMCVWTYPLDTTLLLSASLVVNIYISYGPAYCVSNDSLSRFFPHLPSFLYAILSLHKKTNWHLSPRHPLPILLFFPP